MKTSISKEINVKGGQFEKGQLYKLETKDGERIVLCTSTSGLYDCNFTGTVVHDTFKDGIGLSSKLWVKTSFKPFFGTITITNLND